MNGFTDPVRLSITDAMLTVDDLRSDQPTVLEPPSFMVHIEHGDPIVDTSGFIQGHQVHYLVRYQDQPLLQIQRAAAQVRYDNELSWTQNVRALNTIGVRIGARPVHFFTKKLHTSARGELLPDSSRELWFSIGLEHASRVGEYSSYITG